MSTTSRQNNLILNEDWKRIYQTFKNADFKSYDFENLRRVIITYLRENYPEDFNDYIESSEYLALIDAIAFLGQSLSFRIDLASRENFIELAERKESVLRIARMLSYNAKRNTPSKGLLKFVSVNTTESIFDSNGRDLSRQTIRWNDPTNTNWAEQFISVLNSAMSDNTEFGRSQGSATIQGIPTEQYRFRTTSNDVPVFTFNKSVAGRSMIFEIISTAFKGAEEIYEEAPTPGNQLGFIYRQDGGGPGSANTGFYLQFKQGSLELADFTIASPTTNERIDVLSENINNDDVWLYSLNSSGVQTDQWSKVNNLVGNNIAYNSLVGSTRNIYAIDTKENDKIEFVFADGVYGNLPQGTFRTYYRVSNGLEYVVSPNEMKGINISVGYRNKAGVQHTLQIGLELQSTVSSASATESTDSIRQNAPAVYYTQNRMITGEDYNLAPLAGSQNILKVKAINRTSSGISRNFDIIDASGKYSSINVFGSDGYIYKKDSEKVLSFKYVNRIEIINFIRNQVEKVFSNADVYNFYLTNFDRVLFPSDNTVWTAVTNKTNIGTGYFQNTIDSALLKVGTYSTSGLKYITPGSSIKFTAPAGKHFMKDGTLMSGEADHAGSSTYKWVRVVSVAGDGTNAGRGALATGLGPITFNDQVPTGSIATAIVPRFVNDISPALETEMTNQVVNNLNFGLRYDTINSEWVIVQTQNLDLTSPFSLGKAGDVTNENLDASWVVAFIKDNDQYIVRVRSTEYIFGSEQQNRFYFDKNEKAYNNLTGQLVKDTINILGINATSDGTGQLSNEYHFEISDTIAFDDGYESNKEIKLSFSDKDDDGVIDDPDSFIRVAGVDLDLKYLFFKQEKDSYGTTIFNLVDNSNNLILVYQKQSLINVNDFDDGQLIYFYDSAEDNVKRVDKTTNTLVLDSTYIAHIGRNKIKFQYTHSASEDRRIDPSVTNIVDMFILTRSYDTEYRNWLAGATVTQPVAPTTDSLRVDFGGYLSSIKAISDEVVYHPVKYKVLFGSTASTNLQAQFKVVKNPSKAINDNDLKVRIVTAINNFFDVNNWDFGDRFYLSELTTFVINSVSPDVTNFVIVPRQTSQQFGNLFEIQSKPDEIFANGAKVDDIAIVTSITAAEIGISSTTNTATTTASTSTTTTSSSGSSGSGSGGSGY
jgi:hypothetical protein